ncbi:Fc.00g052100.m01.CDS01 [Cosmosporella sp. VM-42]
MASQQHPAVVVMFVIFLIWLLFPEGEYQNQSLALSDFAAERLARFHDALDTLNKSHWGDFAPPQKATAVLEAKYLNLSGFREEDRFAWEDLGRFRERSLQFSRHAMPSIGGEDLWDIGAGEPVWANASGMVHGQWVRKEGSVKRTYNSYNLTRSIPSMDWLGDKVEWARNMTGDSGRILLRIDSNKTVSEYTQLSAEHAPLSGGVIRNVKGTATIEDTQGSGHSWEMRLWGVHWPHQGVIMMTTTSEKFEGIFGLPHLTPSEDFFQSSQMLLNQTIARTIAKKEENIFIDQSMPWSSDLENPMYTMNPSPHCEYIMYAQVHPPLRQDLKVDIKDPSKDDSMDSIIGAIESELRSPQGAPIPHVPQLQMSAIVYSPDCAFFLETKGPPDFPPSEANHLTGMKTEVHAYQVKTWILVYAIIVFAQVNLLKNQMKESCTPSTMGRVSFWTIGIMVMVDGMTFTAAATWTSSAASTFLPTLALVFSSFLSMTIGGSFLAKIHEVQLPEARPPRERQQTNSNSASGVPSTTTSTSITPNPTGSLLPGPVTASQPGRPLSQPIIIPSDQDIDADIAENTTTTTPPNSINQPSPSSPPQTFQAIIGRFILFSLCLIFLAISSSTWYPRLRGLFLNICIFIYLSLWIPQIHRNILRNCRRALTWPFVLGQSILRVLPIAYFWVKEDNFLYARVDRFGFLILSAWLWLQLVVLAAQDILGPRFGIPSAWTPDAWDYHPILREDNLEAGGLPIGLVADDTPGIERARADDDKAKRRSPIRSIDCAICREVLEVPVVTAEDVDTGVTGVFARRLYMVTPCRHIFHSACLEGWMRFRLQCPICREELPPL